MISFLFSLPLAEFYKTQFVNPILTNKKLLRFKIIDKTVPSEITNIHMDEVTIFAHKLIITAGIILYVFGLIGNALNICVFTIWCYPRKQANRK